MNKNTKIILALLVLTLLICTAFLVFRPGETGPAVARITVNGTLVNEIALAELDEPLTFVYQGPGGFSNTVWAERGRIRVLEAGCPDQICVNQGFISDGTAPIVCLPNKLIIEISGGGEGLDAATG